MQNYLNYVSIEGRYSEPRDGDVGIDLFATSLEEDEKKVVYGTGVRLCPEDKNLNFLVFSRSSICNYDLILANGVGVIDSSYRGEIKLVFRKVGDKIYNIGDKIGQLVAFRKTSVEFIPVEKIKNNTERGENGFGSTGR